MWGKETCWDPTGTSLKLATLVILSPLTYLMPPRLLSKDGIAFLLSMGSGSEIISLVTIFFEQLPRKKFRHAQDPYSPPNKTDQRDL